MMCSGEEFLGQNSECMLPPKASMNGSNTENDVLCRLGILVALLP